MSMPEKCPVCESMENQSPLLEITKMPVFCNVLLPDRQNAMSTPRGDIRLFFCEVCGHVYNNAFDPAKMQYSPRYENSLHYSPRFREYVNVLAKELVEKYRLRGKKVIEIGCGKGDFLKLICSLGDNHGLGFDPSYEEDRVSQVKSRSFSVIRDYYSELYADIKGELLVCRQVLEHIASPRVFLNSIRRTIGENSDTVIFFEVPNVMYTLKDQGIWDLIYEHCIYFSTRSLNHLFDASGFYPVSVKSAFGDQYICLEAYPEVKPDLVVALQTDKLSDIATYASAFAELYQKKLAQWRKILRDMKNQGQRIVVWGAGSKGVTFANILGENAGIDYLVDINPHKQGMYVPGTGQQVIGTKALRKIHPTVVLAMNPLYEGEIKHMLAEHQIAASVMVV